jgi:hypothetical protein
VQFLDRAEVDLDPERLFQIQLQADVAEQRRVRGDVDEQIEIAAFAVRSPRGGAERPQSPARAALARVSCAALLCARLPDGGIATCMENGQHHNLLGLDGVED